MGHPRVGGEAHEVAGVDHRPEPRVGISPPSIPYPPPNRGCYDEAATAGTPGALFLTLRTDGYDCSYPDVEGRTGDAGTRELP